MCCLVLFPCLLLLSSPPKRVHNPLPFPPSPPNIFTIRSSTNLLLLIPIPVLHRSLLLLSRFTLQPHAESPVCPMFAAGPELPVPVDVVEMSTKRGAVECGIEGGAAGHVRWVGSEIGGLGGLVRIEGLVGGLGRGAGGRGREMREGGVEVGVGVYGL